MNKGEVLDKAFEVGVKLINPTTVDPTVAMETLRTSIKAYGKSLDITFSDREIEKKIEEGTRKLEKAGKDHSYIVQE